jgi:hypothetical protein
MPEVGAPNEATKGFLATSFGQRSQRRSLPIPRKPNLRFSFQIFKLKPLRDSHSDYQATIMILRTMALPAATHAGAATHWKLHLPGKAGTSCCVSAVRIATMDLLRLCSHRCLCALYMLLMQALALQLPCVQLVEDAFVSKLGIHLLEEHVHKVWHSLLWRLHS